MIRLLTTLVPALVLAAVLAPFPAAAQEGQTRIQLQPLGDDAGPAVPAIRSAVIDFREEMRFLVQGISSYARSLRPNFTVLAMNGLDLLVKRDPTDENRVAPARAYMRAIDGVVAEGVLFDVARGERPFGLPPDPERQVALLRMTDMARQNGLKVFLIDFSKDQASVDEAHRVAGEKGYISIVSDTPSADIHRLPTYPKRPFGENPKSILALNMVTNFAVIRNSAPFGRPDQFALKMHDTNFDMLAVEVFHGRQPLSKRAVETLKYKKIGARRLVFAFMDVGSAASYHYYWRSGWREGSPRWISAPKREDPDRYSVEYWRPEWQQVITGDTSSYLYGIIAQGFDGVILDGVDTYRVFEGGGEEEQLQ